MNLSNFDVQMYEYAVEEAKTLRETQPDWSKFKTVKELCAMGFTMEQASYGVTKLSNPELTIVDFLEPKKLHTVKETKTAMTALDDIEKIVERRSKEIKRQDKKIEQFGEEIADLKKSVSNLAKAAEDEENEPNWTEEQKCIEAEQIEQIRKEHTARIAARRKAETEKVRKRAEMLEANIAKAKADADAQADTLLADIQIIPPVEHKSAENIKYTSTPLMPPSSDYIRPIEQPKQYEVAPVETPVETPKGFTGGPLVPPIHNLKPYEVRQPKRDSDEIKNERTRITQEGIIRAIEEANRKAKKSTEITAALKRNLEIARPDLAAEFDVEKNGITPDKVRPSNKSEVWWKCKTCGHEYEAKIYNRVYGKAGCPECKARQKRGTIKQSLQYVNPKIAAEFMIEKNGITPDLVPATTKKIYWFKCSNCGREWQARVGARTVYNSENCPDCCDINIVAPDLAKDKNKSFGALYPELLEEWDESNKYDPMSISPRFHLPVVWKCKNCNNRYELTIAHRITSGQGCDKCKQGFNYQLALQHRFMQHGILISEIKQTKNRHSAKGFTNLKKTLSNTRLKLPGKDIFVNEFFHHTYYMYTIEKTGKGYVGLGYYYINDIAEFGSKDVNIYSADYTGSTFTTDESKKTQAYWTRKTGLYLTTPCSSDINEVFKLMLTEMLNKNKLHTEDTLLLQQYSADLKANKDTDKQIVLPIDDVTDTAGENE